MVSLTHKPTPLLMKFELMAVHPIHTSQPRTKGKSTDTASRPFKITFRVALSTGSVRIRVIMQNVQMSLLHVNTHKIEVQITICQPIISLIKSPKIDVEIAIDQLIIKLVNSHKIWVKIIIGQVISRLINPPKIGIKVPIGQLIASLLQV